MDNLEIKKLDGLSMDVVAENKKKLMELFPEVFTEEGIILDKLKTVFGEYVEDKDDYYNFTWNGKDKALRLSQAQSTGTLRPCKEESKNWDTTQNLYIEGDNLEVLMLLRKSYHGKIKMIYIDPPYNKGKDFVYKDNFNDNLKNYLELTKQTNQYGIKANTNSEESGRFHTDWLNMMYPRLRIARELLKDDGVIFISIDDSEMVNLKKLCDEIFGESNFIASIVRNTNSSKNQSLFVSVSHEYSLVYARDITVLNVKHSENKWAVDKNNVDEYVKKVNELQKIGMSNEEITEELKQLTKYPRFVDFTNYWYFDERGLYRKGDLGGVKNGNEEPLFNPITKQYDRVPPGGYRFNNEKLNELISQQRIHFHNDGSLPVIKRYLHENLKQRPKSIMSDDQRPDYSLLKEFDTPFDNPKQLAFMERILSVGDKDSIVLDFFSGSSTTAHAIMNLNMSDGGNRRFIMVQIPELVNEKSEAYESGFRNICEIGRKRLIKAGDKLLEENKDKEGIENLDIGFKVFKLDSSNIKKWDANNQSLEDYLSYMVDNFVEGRNEEDVLYEIMLKYGIDLTAPIESRSIAGKNVYSIGFGALFVCLDMEITIDVVEGIVAYKDELEPARTSIIFRDNGFKDSTVKTNALQILRTNDIEEVMSI